jgi:hypothetical protein
VGGACGYACAPDSPDGAKGPTPDQKGSGAYDGIGTEDERWKGKADKPPAPGPGIDYPERKTQETQKPAGDVPVEQRKDESPADRSQEQPPAPIEQKPADSEKKAEGPDFQLHHPNVASRKNRNAFGSTQRLVQTLRGLDGRITSRSTPERTRVKVYAGEGRVVIARRVVHPSSDWDVSTGTRLVQK